MQFTQEEIDILYTLLRNEGKQHILSDEQYDLLDKLKALSSFKDS